jgi:hypothetical protein
VYLSRSRKSLAGLDDVVGSYNEDEVWARYSREIEKPVERKRADDLE